MVADDLDFLDMEPKTTQRAPESRTQIDPDAGKLAVLIRRNGSDGIEAVSGSSAVQFFAKEGIITRMPKTSRKPYKPNELELRKTEVAEYSSEAGKHAKREIAIDRNFRPMNSLASANVDGFMDLNSDNTWAFRNTYVAHGFSGAPQNVTAVRVANKRYRSDDAPYAAGQINEPATRRRSTIRPTGDMAVIAKDVLMDGIGAALDFRSHAESLRTLLAGAEAQGTQTSGFTYNPETDKQFKIFELRHMRAKVHGDDAAR
ncbi:hypothetical protein M1329_00920 [Candidatus Marsarchaeota archaeon]|nr:hypothetical protein [Candidatus Marsarchaeota archaeon]MCL5099926.1 hypothetical protein [Candidatus Marsarchaeota archaeon]